MTDGLFARYPLLRRLLVFAALLLAVAALAILIEPVLIPMVLACVLYTLLNPINSRLIRLGLNRSWATLLVLAVLMAGSLLLLGLVLPQFSDQILRLQSLIPRMQAVLQSTTENFERWLNEQFGLVLDARDMFFGAADSSSLLDQSVALEISNQLARISLILLLVPILTYFLLRDYRRLRNALMHRLPNRQFELGWLIYHRVARQLQTYVRGVMLQSMIVALVAAGGFYLLGLEMALLLGCITGLLNLIPYVGPLLALVPPLILALGTVPFEPGLVLGVVAVIVTAQIIDNALVIPTVIASAVNLHPLTVILGVVVFGNLFGFIGMIVAIPVISTAKILYAGLSDGLQAAPA